MSAPLFKPTTSMPRVAGGVAQQAAAGFADIAQGKAQPQDTFGPLIDAIKTESTPIPQPGTATPDGSVPGVPMIDIPGTSKVEQKAANLVRKYIGVKYTWGGTSPAAGFDCSGLVQYVYRSIGVGNVPRTTYAQWDAGTPVDPNDLKPGDAVFFTGSDPQSGKPGHEGMYIGNGMFIEAPHSGSTVRVSTLAGRSDFVGARRFA